ncbi:peptidyl-prolyl cis-trans isomerase [Croceicoccus hydrothermalis]|uniref:peptidylprolyl isomerase n=1 Tax=Croceicoccus hydrothermalis TaxID=2867964 RepID=UPI001EFA5F64|nr:peptidylprolyl isomerase [Croceicoccus hydrothermalis]
MTMRERLSKVDPLLLFLVVGVLIFVIAGIVDPRGSDGEETIVVDRATLERYLAAGGGEALAQVAQRADAPPSLDALSPEQRATLIDRYVEEQALYREAVAWGLDDGDIAIRRRLGQSLRFALRPDIAETPSQDTLRRYFRRHAARYREPETIGFDHVFYDAGRGGEDAALSRARAAGLPPADWLAAGERFAYQRSFVGAGPNRIASVMGDDFADRIAQLPTGEWTGPVRSRLGWHYVRIVRRDAGSDPRYEDVREAVLDDWYRERRAAGMNAATRAVVARYDARIDDDIGTLRR